MNQEEYEELNKKHNCNDCYMIDRCGCGQENQGNDICGDYMTMVKYEGTED